MSDRNNSVQSKQRREHRLIRFVCTQGIIQTKMEVGIRFWAPNLGLSPKYD